MRRIGLITLAILLMAFPLLSQVNSISADQTKNQTDINLTDLGVLDIIVPFRILEDDFAHHPYITIPEDNSGAPIGVVIENMNVLTANSYIANFYVFDQSSHDLLWYDHQVGTDLEPFHKDTMFSIDWTPQPGHFAICVSIDFSEDIDTSNNIFCEQQYEAILHPNTVADIINLEILENYPGMLNEDGSIKSYGYLGLEPIVPTHVVSTVDGEELDLVMESTSYMLYAPYYFSDKYSQPAEVFFIDAKDCTITNYSINWFLEIDGNSFLPDTWSKIDFGNQIFGPDPVINYIPQFDVISEEISTEKRDSACVLLVSGKAMNGTDSTAFPLDLDLVETNLKYEQYGMQLQDGQINRIDNASKTDILLALQQMQDQCDKIIFYYTGHGDIGEMVTSGDDDLYYADLAEALFNTNAQDVTVIIDACHSGSAETSLRAAFDNTPRKLTILTASSAENISYTDNVITTESGERYSPGFFTWNLMKQYGDPNADTDGDHETSFPEAFYRLRKVNPSSESRGPINEVQDPQLIFNKVIYPEPEQTQFSVPEIGLEMNYFQPLDENAMIRVSEKSGIYDTEFSDDSIIYISDTRYYSIDLKEQYNPFQVDVTFTYNGHIDSVRNSVVDMGLVKRDTAGTAWEKIPSIHLPDLKKIIATNVTGFSDFAFAHVIPGAVTGFDPAVSGSSNFMVYPNPVTDLLTIDMKEQGRYLIQFASLNGQLLYNREMEGTDHQIDLSSFQKGVYLLTIRSKDIIKTEKIIKL